MRTKSNIAWLFLWGFIVLFAMESCKVGEDYKREAQEVPSTIRNDFPKDSSITNLPWWELFKDTVLIDLINTALIENKNIQIAVARMQESLLYFEISKADFYPNISYGMIGSTSVNSQSSGTTNAISPVLNVSYTIDLWQKIKTMNEVELQEY